MSRVTRNCTSSCGLWATWRLAWLYADIMGFVWFMYAFCMECVEYISQNGEFAKGSRNMDKKVIAARLFSERKRLGFKSALSFSDSLSLPNNTYSGWEAGRSVPKADDLADMAAAGLDVQYLVSGQRSLVSCVPDDVVRIPVMQDEPSAGNGAAADGLSMVRGFLDVQQDWAAEFLGRDAAQMRLLFARGNSMSPTIHNGDPVFVDPRVRCFAGEGIYVFDFMGELLLKRLEPDLVRQVLLLRSDNEAEYPTREVRQGEVEQLHICGRVQCWLNLRRG